MSTQAAAGCAAGGIYVHVPFCARVCPYCDFAVTTGSAARRAAYVETLVAEVKLHSGEALAFDTVYLGGGTPSLLAPADLERVLAALGATFRLEADTWITLEANPEDVTPERARAWAALGVRTVSLGAQSLDDAALRFLGRRHDARAVLAACEALRAIGFPVVSLDLIYGLPDETPAAWARSIDRATALAPDHLSCYQLSMPEGTPFGKRLAAGAVAELDEATQADLFVLTHERLAALGYTAYEVSSFARTPAHRSRHNRKYWEHVPYLGLGPAAHSFRGRTRSWNERAVAGWEPRVRAGVLPTAGSEELTPLELATEALMLGLRTPAGVDLEALATRFGATLPPGDAGPLPALVAEGLLRVDGTRLLPTLRGLAVADGLAATLAQRLGQAA